MRRRKGKGEPTPASRLGRRNMGVGSWQEAKAEKLERLAPMLRRVTEEHAHRARRERE